MADRLKDKVVLVTGGGSGIGLASARRFAREHAAVAIIDKDVSSGRRAAEDVGGIFVEADVSTAEEMEAAVSAVVSAYGRLDVAHLNAGVITGETDLERVEIARYRKVMGVNADGVFYGVRYCLPAMSEGGSIVVTASLAGLVAYRIDPVYAASKHAVIGLVRALGDDLMKRGIGIAAVCPGFVDTSMLGEYAPALHEAGFPVLSPDDVAGAAVEAAIERRGGAVYVCQPGRDPLVYEFRGVPGPRVEGERVPPPPI